VTIPPSKAALDLARQLLDRGIAGAIEPAETGAALQRTLARVSENLRRAIGDDGYAALLSRAIAQTQTDHLRLRASSGDASLVFPIDALTADVGTHDIHLVSAAFESILASIIDVLSGLIGADMEMNLLDPDDVSTASPRIEDHNDRS
jgi:hypothetical protein